jgi:hypothetical protein
LTYTIIRNTINISNAKEKVMADERIVYKITTSDIKEVLEEDFRDILH